MSARRLGNRSTRRKGSIGRRTTNCTSSVTMKTIFVFTDVQAT